MSFFVYRPFQRLFFAAGEPKGWTASMFDAAAFPTRERADEVAEAKLGPGHDAWVLDDGYDTDADSETVTDSGRDG